LTYKAFLSRANLDPNTIVTITWSDGEYKQIATFDRHGENDYDPIEFEVS